VAAFQPFLSIPHISITGRNRDALVAGTLVAGTAKRVSLYWDFEAFRPYPTKGISLQMSRMKTI
jgi:hypothetical protein